MTVQIEKQIKITIDGEDVDVLKTVCEWASKFADSRRHIHKDERWVAEWNQREAGKMLALIDHIFDA